MTTLIAPADVLRLMSELQANLNIDGHDEAENLVYLRGWFEKNNFEDEFAEWFIQYAVDGFNSVMNHLISKGANDDESGVFALGPMIAMTPDVINSGALAIACGMFQLGWETRKQYAGGSSE